MTHGNTGTLQFRALRAALDRVTYVYSRRLDETVHRRVFRMETLQLPVTGGLLVLCRRGRATDDAPQAVWSGDGVFVQVRIDSDTKQGTYPVRIECQGLLCSTSETGVESSEAARIALEAILYPGLSDVLETETFPGRFDVCVDVEVSGNGASEWIESVLFANGNVDQATERWATRAKKSSRRTVHTTHAKLLGVPESGRTLYYGRQPQIRLYEKDRESEIGRDGPIVRERWYAAGWKGPELSRVIRIEWEVMREWITAQSIHTHDGSVIKASVLPWSGFNDLLGVVALLLASRYRHVDLSTATRRHRCKTSPWFAVAVEALRALDTKRGTWTGIAFLKSQQRAKHLQKSLRKAQIAMIELQVHRPDLSFAEIAHDTAEDLIAKLAPSHAGTESELWIYRQRRQDLIRKRLGLESPED